MTQHDKAPELVERLKVVARCGTDSTMRHFAYAFMTQNPDGDYVTYCAYAALAEENRRLREALEPFAAIADLFDSEVEGHADTAISDMQELRAEIERLKREVDHANHE